jgi:predicted Rossmann fold flavoprotein
VDYDVVIIGAGAAGLLAASRAAERGRRTLLLEKNRKPGVKILMSGGTRCNITHAIDAAGIIAAYPRDQGRFLHSPLAALGPKELIALIEAEGVATKIEATGKIFPVSDRAVDVLDALLARLGRSGAELASEEPVTSLVHDEAGTFSITTSKRTIQVQNVILTTGGKSYPGSGTTGDGYAWAASMGHNIIPPRPALVPVTTTDAWVSELKGVTIPDVGVRVLENSERQAPSPRPSPRGRGRNDALAETRGSFLLTHFGLSGPAVLDVSRAITGHASPNSLILECDFLPAENRDALQARLTTHLQSQGAKQIANAHLEEVPARLWLALLAQASIDPATRSAELSKDARRRLVESLKATRIQISGTRGFAKAEVTAGGVDVREVDSRTMQSKLVPGLYFAGEILDLDGPIGGYNFQAAFSTGWLAGESV